MVKDQHGYGQKSKPMAAHTGSSQPTRQRPPPERAIIRSKPPPRDDDSFTLHSHDTESEQDEAAEESAIDAVYHHPVLIRARARRQQSPPPPPSDVSCQLSRSRLWNATIYFTTIPRNATTSPTPPASPQPLRIVGIRYSQR